MPNVGPWEIILLLLLALLLFGAKRLVGTQDTTAPAQQRERDTVP